MEFDGSQIQNEIYISGESPWPVSFADWEARARETLEPGPFGYIAGGAGSEATMRANLEAFERRRLRPKMLTGNAVRDLSVEVLGTRSPVPFFLAPVGVLSIAHAEGELAVARAAAALGIPLVLSSAASHSMEEVAVALGDTPRWFQLYWVSDPDVAGSLVDRAAAAGYSARTRQSSRLDCASCWTTSSTSSGWLRSAGPPDLLLSHVTWVSGAALRFLTAT